MALDGKGPWSTTDARNLARALTEGANFRVCVDGARRGSGDSAAGVAIVAYYRDGSHAVVHRGGKLLGSLPSAFMAEALALEWELETFARMRTE